MTTIPETLRQASEALQQASAALVATAQTMEDAPTPAAEPEPGEWRNDRAPKGYEADHQGLVWTWTTRGKVLTPVSGVKRDDYWALGHRPAPKSPPPDVVASREVEPQPEALPEPNESPARRWIIDRPPTEEDDWVAIPARPGTDRSGFEIAAWCYAYPGTPWAPFGAIPDEPFDPTCLDRNGWIRSRLPTVEDANDTGLVLLPMGNGGVNSVIAYDLIVPGQPWAPWGSSPGGFEK